MSNAVKEPKAFVREAKLTDIAYLAVHIRECDRKEIWAMSHKKPEEAFLQGYNISDTPYVVEWQGKAIAMFGVCGEKGSLGVPWMLATDDIKKIKKEFIAQCKPYVEAMHKDYPLLTNFVWEKNPVHIIWLKWLGFDFGQPIAIGIDGEKFIQFYKVKEDV
jgi:hypothetical protein